MKRKKTNLQVTKNFNLMDLEKTDIIPDKLKSNCEELLENLQTLRDIIEEPIEIISGYRTKESNENVGGVVKSQHLYGKAADIVCNKYNSLQIYLIILKLITVGKMKKGGLGLYDKFVHYDIRGNYVSWNYSKYNKNKIKKITNLILQNKI